MKTKLSIFSFGQLAVCASASAAAVVDSHALDPFGGMNMGSKGIVVIAASIVCVTAGAGIVFVSKRVIKKIKDRKIIKQAQLNEVAAALLKSEHENSQRQQDGYKVADLPKGDVLHVKDNQNTTRPYSVQSPNSLLAMLEASSHVDPVAAGHGIVILVEMIRHAKETAQQIHTKADTVLSQSSLAQSRGLKLNPDLLEAIKMAHLAKEFSSQAMQINDDMSLSNPAALLIWQRSQFDECLSILALARAKLVPAIEKWQMGIKQYRGELTDRANKQKIEADNAYRQVNNFIDAIETEFEHVR